MDAIKVVIAEDHLLTAKLLQKVLEKNEEIDVVAVVDNGRDLINYIKSADVDIVLLDINLPYVDGIEAMEKMFHYRPFIKILVLSGHEEAWVIKKSLNAGASGYLTKKVSHQEIVDALTVVYRGGSYMDGRSLDTIVDDYDLEKPKRNYNDKFNDSNETIN